jgi:acyl carrier protein
MIDQQEFLKAFSLIFEETEPGDISLDTHFKDLPEWGSLITLSAIVSMEENFKKILTAKQIEKANTVKDLYNILNTGDL